MRIETVADALSWAIDELRRTPFRELRASRSDRNRARAEIEWMLTEVLGATRGHLRAHGERRLSTREQRTFEARIRRYAGGEPLAYITGHQAFWKLDLEVDPRVLIPRPETELLVQAAVELATPPDGRVLDLGTGCGAIALSLALERPGWHVLASDVSADALAVAVRNYTKLAATHAMAQVRFRCSDWFSQIEEQFDIIVANPPYVALDDPCYEGCGYEPDEALFPGCTGLEALRTLIGDAPGHLRGEGCLLVEHGHLQGASVRDMMCAAGLAGIESRRDLAGHERISLGYNGRRAVR